MRIGFHVKKTGLTGDKKFETIGDAIRSEVKERQITAAQIFTHGPQFFKKNKIIPADFKDIGPTDLTVHCCYPSAGFWKDPEDEKKDKQLHDMIEQANVCKDIHAWGAVIHIYNKDHLQIKKRCNLLKDHYKKQGVVLLLEMSAGKSSETTYDRPERINLLVDTLYDGTRWFGITVDTAHIWGAGQNIKSYDDMKKWLDGIKRPEYIRQFHLNGSRAGLGSGTDYHAAPFESVDQIWHGVEFDKSGVKAVLQYAKKYNITVICEINEGDSKELSKCWDNIRLQALKI